MPLCPYVYVNTLIESESEFKVLMGHVRLMWHVCVSVQLKKKKRSKIRNRNVCITFIDQMTQCCLSAFLVPEIPSIATQLNSGLFVFLE